MPSVSCTGTRGATGAGSTRTARWATGSTTSSCADCEWRGASTDTIGASGGRASTRRCGPSYGDAMYVRAAALAIVLLVLAPAWAEACTSRAVGLPNHGRLVCGVRLPGETDALVTWDSILGGSPSRGWRRWGTSKLVD